LTVDGRANVKFADRYRRRSLRTRRWLSLVTDVEL